MPVVTAPSRSSQNGEVVTSFTDSVGTTSTTYTYNTSQEGLTIVNNGSALLTVTINGVAHSVSPFTNYSEQSSFSSFAIVATSGNQAFIATSYRQEQDEMQLTGSNVTLLSAVSATGAGTPKPVGSFKNYSFEVWGTASSFTLQIQAVGPSGSARNLKVWDELNNTFLTGTDITASGFYSVSAPAFTNIQANVSAISGGNVNVAGGLMP